MSRRPICSDSAVIWLGASLTVPFSSAHRLECAGLVHLPRQFLLELLRHPGSDLDERPYFPRSWPPAGQLDHTFLREVFDPSGKARAARRTPPRCAHPEVATVPLDPAGSLGELRSEARHLHRPDPVDLRFQEHLSRLVLGVLHDIGDGVDRSGRHVRPSRTSKTSSEVCCLVQPSISSSSPRRASCGLRYSPRPSSGCSPVGSSWPRPPPFAPLHRGLSCTFRGRSRARLCL